MRAVVAGGPWVLQKVAEVAEQLERVAELPGTGEAFPKIPLAFDVRQRVKARNRVRMKWTEPPAFAVVSPLALRRTQKLLTNELQESHGVGPVFLNSCMTHDAHDTTVRSWSCVFGFVHDV